MTKSSPSVSEIIRDREVFALPGEATARQAAQLMEEHGVGAIVVVEDQKLLGIFTERDLTRELVSLNFDPDKAVLRDIMTPDPDTIGVEGTSADVLERMDAGGYRHLPVVDADGKFVGIVSRRDFF